MGLLSFVNMLAVIPFRALVLSWLWYWFVTPVFGLSVPSLPLLYGLTLVASFLTHQISTTDIAVHAALEEDAQVKLRFVHMAMLWVWPVLLLLFGFVTSRFVS